MLAECPDCRQRLRWTYLLNMSAPQWRCEGCGSLLEFDGKRRMLTVALSLPSVAVMTYAVPSVGIGGVAIIGIILGVHVASFCFLTEPWCSNAASCIATAVATIYADRSPRVARSVVRRWTIHNVKSWRPGDSIPS